MIKMTLSEIATILDTTFSGKDVTISGFSKDGRTAQQNKLFVGIIGEQFDGNNFAADAYQNGAAAALVNRKLDCPIPQVQVDDTLEALGKLTQDWRDRFSLPLIGVTGSNGKTTLKNMIAAILTAACQGRKESVLATEGNLNNNIGVPFTLSRLNAKQCYGVIEMGMNNAGEIAYLTQLVKPQVAVITNAAESHLQGLKDITGVAKAKGEIFLGLTETGTAVLNRDDTHFDYWRSLIGERRYYTFGFTPDVDFTADIHAATQQSQQLITLKTPKGTIDIQLPLLGKHNVMNSLAAAAATMAIGIDLTAIKQGLESLQAAPGRLNIHELDNDVRIIDDTYNANPFSTQAAINALAAFSGKRILVLGDMRELGANELELHALTGQRAQEAGINKVFTFGKLSEETTKRFGAGAQHFTDRDALIAALKPELQAGTTVLVKGSRSMKMELVVSQLMPEHLLQAH